MGEHFIARGRRLGIIAPMETPVRLWIFSLCALGLFAQTARHITSPKEEFGFNIGDDYRLVNYSQLEAYWKKLASESDRMKLTDIGMTSEGPPSVDGHHHRARKPEEPRPLQGHFAEAGGGRGHLLRPGACAGA